jgi:hypothetical protein
VPRTPATAPALHASLPDLNCAAARIAAVVSVMWNMRKRHFSHSWLTAAARMAVKGARTLRVHRSAAETLDGHRSGGYARERACDASFRVDLLFSTGLRRSNLGYSRRNREQPISPLVA